MSVLRYWFDPDHCEYTRPDGQYVKWETYDALAVQLAVEKMQHSVTIADEHESRSEFQDRIRELEALIDEPDDLEERIRSLEARIATLTAEVMHYTAGTPHPELALRQTAEAYAARNALRVIELEAALRDLLDDLSEDLGQRHHRDKYRVYQVGPQTIEAARALLPALETKSAPGFCPECLMTGGHKLRCSKAETKRKCPECVYDVSNPFICERCGTPMGPTVAETTPKPITTFTGWIQGSCDNCGKSAREHVGISMGCPQAETKGDAT